MPVRSWPDAEALTVQVLVNLGFIDAKLTPSGPDAGIDALARKAVGQAKYERSTTGAPAVQALAGVASVEGKQGVFLSLAGYTAQAVTFADRSGTALYSYTEGGTVTAVSSAARRLLQQAQDKQSDPASRRRLQRERRSVEQSSEKVAVLLSQTQWLAKAVAQSQRQDKSRSGQRAQRKVIDAMNRVLQEIAKVDDVPVGWQQASLLSGAPSRLKDAAKTLGVKLPKS